MGGAYVVGRRVIAGLAVAEVPMVAVRGKSAGNPARESDRVSAHCILDNVGDTSRLRRVCHLSPGNMPVPQSTARAMRIASTMIVATMRHLRRRNKNRKEGRCTSSHG